MGTPPYKTIGSYIRWEPYHIKQMGSIKDGSPTGEKDITSCFVELQLVCCCKGVICLNKLDFYYLDIKYIRELSSIDDNIMSISPQRGKQNRPFVGVVTVLGGRKYCIPLTSPKDKFAQKKSQVDFIKIFDEGRKDKTGMPKLIGVLNINNMLPVSENVVQKVDLRIHPSDIPEIKRAKALMQKQLEWCRNHADVIENRAQKVYDLVNNHPDKNRNLVKRSSKFIELETVLDKRNRN